MIPCRLFKWFIYQSLHYQFVHHYMLFNLGESIPTSTVCLGTICQAAAPLMSVVPRATQASAFAVPPAHESLCRPCRMRWIPPNWAGSGLWLTACLLFHHTAETVPSPWRWQGSGNGHTSDNQASGASPSTFRTSYNRRWLLVPRLFLGQQPAPPGRSLPPPQALTLRPTSLHHCLAFFLEI